MTELVRATSYVAPHLPLVRRVVPGVWEAGGSVQHGAGRRVHLCQGVWGHHAHAGEQRQHLHQGEPRPLLRGTSETLFRKLWFRVLNVVVGGKTFWFQRLMSYLTYRGSDGIWIIFDVSLLCIEVTRVQKVAPSLSRFTVVFSHLRWGKHIERDYHIDTT